MLLLIILHCLLADLVKGVPMQPGCCGTKDVGGVSYTLVGQMDTRAYQCLNDCIYVKEEDPDVKVCFAAGDLEVECTEDELQPSGLPLIETTEKSQIDTTKTPEGSDDEVVTRVKGYIDAGTCNTVTFPTEYSDTLCGDNAVSYYKEFLYNDKRVIISNNIPDHPAETDAISINPNLRCTGWQYLVIPVDPAKGSTMTDTGLGTIGLAVTGGAFFNDLSNPDGSLAMPNEGASLDSCLGHSAPTGGMGGGGPGGAGGPGGPGGRPPPGGGPPGGRVKRQEDVPHVGQYHYHGNLNCTDAGSATGANNASKCLLIGYYRDGVPVYGFCKDQTGMMMTSCYKTSATLTTVVTASGTYQTASSNSDYTFSPDANCNLDEASGAVHPTTGQYSYFMTTDYPWIPVKFAGDQGSDARPCSAD